jgi:hypothetical protein
MHLDPVAYALKRVQDQLQNAQQFLAEVSSIGVWVTSDDCGDNRERRRRLREFRTEIGGAQVSLRDMKAEPQPNIAVPLQELSRDLDVLYKELAPLIESVTDTFNDVPDLDSIVRKLEARVSALQQRTSLLLEQDRREATPQG